MPLSYGLMGFVTNEDEYIEALVIEYVPSAELARDRKRIDNLELSKRTWQMKEAH
jgi:hypothetical protein